MYSILFEIKQTIASYKKQIEQKQNNINAHVQEQGKLLNEMDHLKERVGMLEGELSQLEKQVQSTEQKGRATSNNGCCVAVGPHSFVPNREY